MSDSFMSLFTDYGYWYLHHNHPSGDPSPSAEDIAFTRRLADAGAVRRS